MAQPRPGPPAPRRAHPLVNVPDTRPADRPPTAPVRLNLAYAHHYAWLISAAFSTDLWVRRYRGPRRRRVTLTTTPPHPPGIRRTLLWAHQPLADLGWAPRPPRPEIRERRATMLIRALLLLTFGPIGLLLILAGVGKVGPDQPTYPARPLPARDPAAAWRASCQQYMTYHHLHPRRRF